MQSTRMDEPGELYIVSTPIGNLMDITLRALEVLRRVDYIICEDTRVTIKLLNRYDIKKPLISHHSKSGDAVLRKILRLVLSGNSAALVTDSGTPVVSDPGAKLIRHLIKSEVPVIPVPGPSSVHTALVASGFLVNEYTFIGFISNKASRRRRRLEELKNKTTIFVFFESPHRIIPFLQDAGEAFGKVQICVAKEMTKKFEKYYRGVIPEVIERVGEDIVKGEYTIIIDNRAGMGL